MSDLNVALILRLVDRLSGPARTAARQLGNITKAQRDLGREATASAKTTGAATKATTALGVAAKTAAASTKLLGAAAKATGRAASESGRAQSDLARSTDAAGRSAETAYRKFSDLERVQLRGRAAARMLGGEMEKLDRRLGTLAKLSLATQGMGQAGRAILGPLGAAVRRQAGFQRQMTGVGIITGLPDSALGEVRANVFRTANQLALPLDRVLGVHGAVLNEGAYRTPAELGAAARSVSGLQLLADIGGDPISDQEAGSLTSAYAYSLGAKGTQLDRLNAMLFKSSQLGGTRAGTVMRHLPEVLGNMKAFGLGNDRGYADALTAFQIVKRTAGDDNQAAVYTKDLMANITHRFTLRRFARNGVDLKGELQRGWADGKSPLEVVTEQVGKLTRGLKGPALKAKISELFANQQATAAILALMQNWEDGANGVGFKTMRRQVLAAQNGAEYRDALKRASSGPAADYQRLGNAKDALAIQTGQTLAPATRLLARVGAAGLGGLTGVMAHGGALGTAAALTVGGVGVVATGASRLGEAAMGILGPWLIMRTLFGKGMPLAFTAAGAGIRTFVASAVPAVLSFSAALLTNPVTWVVAGIVALVAAGYLLVKNWGAVKKWLGSFWQGVQDLAGRAFEKVKAFFTWKPPPWLGLVAGVVTGNAALVAASAAAAAAPPVARTVARAAGAVGRPHVVHHHVSQTFHVHGGGHDTKTLARHLDRLAREGHARAMHDGAE